MLNKSLCILAASLLLCGAALAQKALGTAADVQGLVTVSDGTSISTVQTGTPIVDGTRFVTSSSGSAALKLENGCDIILKPNQSVTILGDKNCGALLAAVQNTSTERFAGFFGSTTGMLAVGGALATTGLLIAGANTGTAAIGTAAIANQPISGQ